jgi:hypothetical protein
MSYKQTSILFYEKNVSLSKTTDYMMRIHYRNGTVSMLNQTRFLYNLVMPYAYFYGRSDGSYDLDYFMRNETFRYSPPITDKTAPYDRACGVDYQVVYKN